MRYAPRSVRGATTQNVRLAERLVAVQHLDDVVAELGFYRSKGF